MATSMKGTPGAMPDRWILRLQAAEPCLAAGVLVAILGLVIWAAAQVARLSDQPESLDDWPGP